MFTLQQENLYEVLWVILAQRIDLRHQIVRMLEHYKDHSAASYWELCKIPDGASPRRLSVKWYTHLCLFELSQSTFVLSVSEIHGVCLNHDVCNSCFLNSGCGFKVLKNVPGIFT